jgi:hypothetical protein
MTITHTYQVRLQRINPSAGPYATLTILVDAPNDRMAKLTAESQYHGYRATGAGRAP